MSHRAPIPIGVAARIFFFLTCYAILYVPIPSQCTTPHAISAHHAWQDKPLAVTQ